MLADRAVQLAGVRRVRTAVDVMSVVRIVIEIVVLIAAEAERNPQNVASNPTTRDRLK